jgi:hypothetical protein
MKTTFDLIRQPSYNGYIFGTIYNDSERICDTLELESELLLPAGKHEILCNSEWLIEHEIFIANNLSVTNNSKFCHNNYYKYRNITIRNHNNHIVIGQINDSATLKNELYHYSRFMELVIKLLKSNAKIYINISNAVETPISEMSNDEYFLSYVL